MAYKAPIWEDGKSPAISAENLNNLSQAAEGAQVLYGNSAPTSSTEGAVGQFYLVVVADSDGNYPLYQCVAITNGSYGWRDTRRIPDSITSMLGIPAPGTINSALNVLAHVGNLHVWQRVLTTIDASYVERRVNISDANIFSSDYQSSRYYARFNVSDSINITSSGDISLVSPTQVEIYFQSDALYNFDSLKGKYISYVSTASNSSSSFPGSGNIGYISSDAEVSITHSNYYQAKITSGAYKVYSVFVPAVTTTDYLTSTDPDAYPKQSAEGGQDAYYSLGEVQRQYLGVSSSSGSAIQFTVKYSDSLSVSEDGTLTLGPTNEYTATIRTGYTDSHVSSLQSLLVGKFFTVSWNDTDVTSPDGIFFSPSDALVSYVTNGTSLGFPENLGYYIDKAQPVTGHAAIPANTSITYLGQLGGGARIEVGSYVGTGTYGSDNPCSITLSKDSAIVFILQNGVFKGVLSKRASDAGGYSLVSTSSGSGEYFYSFLQLNVSASGNTISWWHKYDSYQLNVIGNTYTWVALAIG